MSDVVTEQEIESEPFTEEELAEARRYSVVVQWSPADGVWIATLPEFGGRHTHGATPAEAVEMGAELAALCLDVLRRSGEPIPPPRLFNDQQP